MAFKHYFADKETSRKENRKRQTVAKKYTTKPKYKKYCKALNHGFTVCLHGYGSKEAVLEQLQAALNGTFDVLVLSSPEETHSNAAIQTHIEASSSRKKAVFVDGVERFSSKTLSALVAAKSAHRIRLLFTTDSVCVLLAFPPSLIPRLSLLWFHCRTNTPYRDDTAETALPQARACQSILTAVSQTTKRIVEQIVLLCGDTSSVLLETALRRCNELLLVSNEAVFRTHLTEFIDHAIFKIKRTRNGKETIFIDKASL
eukprot:GHVN01046290.1.p1 GENE.GHVN01046290.1~~GHVN01046290.1.p1  ORF type:complete len:258 (-),score=35.72 GHVN01046290.1:152-925(-)